MKLHELKQVLTISSQFPRYKNSSKGNIGIFGMDPRFAKTLQQMVVQRQGIALHNIWTTIRILTATMTIFNNMAALHSSCDILTEQTDL